MGARMVFGAAVLAAAFLVTSPAGAQGCYPPPCGSAETAVHVAGEHVVNVAEGPGGLPAPASREPRRTASAGAALDASVGAGLALVGGTLLAVTRRRLRSGRPNLEGA